MAPKYPIREDIKIDNRISEKWQKMLDVTAEVMNVPFSRIMRVHAEEIEVFTLSNNAQNIYQKGEKAPLNTGRYCETVLDKRSLLVVRNALKSKRWKSNPDIKHGLIAYMGCPIFWPTGEIFGTVCVLDTKARSFKALDLKLLQESAEIIGGDLEILITEQNLRNEIEGHLTAVRSLSESEERFKKAFQTSIAGMNITTLNEGINIDVNEGYCRITGYSREEIIGKTTLELGIYADETEKEKLRNLIISGETIQNFEIKILTKSGETKIVELSAKTIAIDNRPCVLFTIYDVTPLKKLEADLRNTGERYALALRAAEAGVWDWDVVNDVLTWDDRMANLYGTESKQFSGAYRIWKTLMEPEDFQQRKETVEKALRGEAEYDTEFKVRLKDGSVRYIKACGDVLRDREGRAVRMVGINQDITEKKKLEEALAVSEKLYKALFNESSAVRLVVDVETSNVFDTNPAAQEFYGYTKSQFIGKSVTELNRLSMKETVEKLQNAYLMKSSYFTSKHYLSNGESRFVEVFSGPVDIQGRKYINCIIHDVTERKRTLEALIESETRYRNLFNLSYAVQLIFASETGAITDANAAACGFYNFSIDEIKTKKVWDLNPADKEFLLNRLKKAFTAGSDLIYTTHRRGDGELRDVEVFSCRAESGGRKFVHAIIHDVTERKQAQQALIDSEKRFRLLVENAPDCVFVETDYQFAYVNKRTVALFGFASEKELNGRIISSFFPAEVHSEALAFMRALNEDKILVPPRETEIIRPDGTRIAVEVTAVPLEYEGKNGALVYMRDITERKEYEKSRSEMEMQLRQKQKLESIGTLAGGVAHEINNPVNGIINYAQLVCDDPSTGAKAREYCAEIIKEGQRVANIVKNLLSFARQEKQSHSPARIDDIINATLSLIRTVIRHDQIELVINIPKGLPSIKCRSQQIQQVIMNLVTNARDALNEKFKGDDANSKKITVNCNLIRRAGLRWLKVTVEDNGGGIPDNVIDKIFDPFFTTKPRDKGTGLGLSISHGIVKDHRGELYFETEPGKFTRAIMELPVDNGWAL